MSEAQVLKAVSFRSTSPPKAVAVAKPVREIERVALIEAVGRILGKDVSALIDLPPFDNSALDGYAVRISDFTGAGPWELSVGGTIAAGGVYAGEAVHPQEALRIFTGAPVGTC